MRIREHTSRMAVGMVSLLTTMQVMAQHSRYVDYEPMYMDDARAGTPGLLLLFYLICLVAIVIKWQTLDAQQKRFGIIGSIIGAFFGSGFGIAGGGSAVNGMLFIAFVGFLLGVFLAPKQDSDSRNMWEQDDLDE